MDFSDQNFLQFTYIFIALLLIYWALRGIGLIFEQNNTILVVCYFVFLFPIAFFHSFILGLLVPSKKSRLRAAVKKEADFKLQVDKEIAKRSKD